MYNPRNFIMLCNKLLEKKENSPITIIDESFSDEALSKVLIQLNNRNEAYNRELL